MAGLSEVDLIEFIFGDDRRTCWNFRLEQPPTSAFLIDVLFKRSHLNACA